MNAALPEAYANLTEFVFFTFYIFKALLLLSPNIYRLKLLKPFLAWSYYFIESLGTAKSFSIAFRIYKLMDYQKQIASDPTFWNIFNKVLFFLKKYLKENTFQVSSWVSTTIVNYWHVSINWNVLGDVSLDTFFTTFAHLWRSRCRKILASFNLLELL